MFFFFRLVKYLPAAKPNLKNISPLICLLLTCPLIPSVPKYFISIFHSLGLPILVGNSRKRFIKEISGKNDTKNRIGGTVASSIYLMMQGVQILRVHDVNELLQGIKVFNRLIDQ